MTLRTVVGLLLLSLVTWRSLAAVAGLVKQLSSVTPALLARSISADEEARIEQSLRFYANLPEEPADMYALYLAIVEHTPHDARIFVLAGDHPRLPRALINLQSFFYPRRLHVATEPPERDRWNVRPEFYALTLAGPNVREPEGVLTPLVTNDAWTLWH